MKIKKKNIKVRAVVLGGNSNALGHIRALGKMGIYSYVVCSGRDFLNLARFSKYAIPLFVPEDINNYEYVLKVKLLELAKDKSRRFVLYATSDYFVDFIDRNQFCLKKYYLFNIPENTVLKLIVNKFETCKLARNSGIIFPNTIRIKANENVSSVFNSISFPCIIKAEDSYSITFPGKNKIAHDCYELNEFFENYPTLKEHVIIQDIVPGGEKNIYQCTVYIGKNGLMQQHFTMQKLYQRPPFFGITTIGRSVKMPQIINYTEKLLKNIDYTGFASVEFKKSDKDSKYYLIEINPRLPWYNSLFLSCGVNFPFIAYKDLTSENKGKAKVLKQRDGVHWINLRDALSGFRQRVENGEKLDLLEVIDTMLKIRSFSYLKIDDMLPYLMSMLDLINSVKTKILK